MLRWIIMQVKDTETSSLNAHTTFNNFWSNMQEGARYRRNAVIPGNSLLKSSVHSFKLSCTGN